MIHSENCHDDLIDLVLKYFLNETLTPSQYAPTPEHGLSQKQSNCLINFHSQLKTSLRYVIVNIMLRYVD